MDIRTFRKNQDTLVATGNGILAFGFWGIIKTILYLIVRRKEFLKEFYIPADETGLGRDQIETIIVILFFAVLVFSVLLVTWAHTYVGLHARSEGLGRKHSSVYLFIAGILLLSSVTSVCYEIWTIAAGSEDSWDMIASLIVDLTMIITIAQMIRAARKVKAYRKTHGEAE